MSFDFFNPRRGELVARMNGKTFRLRLTLAALSYLESLYDGEDILLLVRRFSNQGMSATDVENILQAGVYGAGYDPIKNMEIHGGFTVASAYASKLLERAFIASE